ncbi:MAG: hypothetical protein PHQ23_08995 [Candidatus Wallbacteria bacterium]|nr:hypothetical protein [Candidatus Wallbacteria bacterium]
MPEFKKPEIKNKGLIFSMIGLLVVAIVLKFTVLKKKDPLAEGFISQESLAQQSPPPAVKPAAQQPQTSRRNIHEPQKQAAQPGAQRPVPPPQLPGQQTQSSTEMMRPKRTFTGYESIRTDLSTAETTTSDAQTEVVQNILQDFKNSIEQKNKAKVAIMNAEEALKRLRITMRKLKDNQQRALAEYLKSPTNFLKTARTNFSKGSYLEAENYASKVINDCSSFKLSILEGLFNESISFRYRGYYDYKNSKVAVLTMISTATGLIEGTSSRVVIAREGEVLSSNQGERYKVVEISPEVVVIDDTVEKKELTIPFELFETQEESF